MSPDGSVWNDTDKIIGDGPLFDIYSTAYVETVSFIVATYFQNSLVHNSPIINVTITCGSGRYEAALVNDKWSNTHQFVKHNSKQVGFQVPSMETVTYQSSCPVTAWQVSRSGLSLRGISDKVYAYSF